MKNLRYILAVAMLPLILCGCNQEDDIMEIFANGQTWHWSSSYTTSDWEDDNKGTSSLTQSEIRQINENADVYIIQFSDDGTLEGKGSSFSFTGRWSANGKDQTISITLNPSSTPSGLDKTFHDEIQNAQFYRGNSRFIKLFNSERNHFIQFYPLGI
ncbi:DUF4847 family protein [Bacteroides sp. ET225]|uniref:DUF4847 family protein n=1 Tax=Bacteroides sp. ET225 TaxID=2972461 RepID=UPI001DF0B332|nr:DUF4847 family protein [Bacteroides sp. ET225]MBW9198758.1 DUF4847 domain-containing protein [Bacteroidales bacterium SW299]MCR8918055.1 DUF4847 family protein [Bacteroides sp. ET225]